MPRLGTKSLCLLLLALTVTAYLPIWHNEFVDFDDELYITSNPHVTGGLSAANFVWAWSNLHARYWQPLTWLSLQLDAHCFSGTDADGKPVPSPAVFHAQNLFWHCADVLLLFVLWQRMTGASWQSFLIAALFAVHPMHVESVAWAVERKDVLSCFFGLLTVWAYLRYLDQPSGKRYAVMLLTYPASLMVKPMLMTLPFVLLLLDYWPLRRIGPRSPGEGETAQPSLRRVLLEKAPLFAVAVAFAVITQVARTHTGAAMSLHAIPMSARLANAAAAYGWYVRTTFWPVNLCALYPHPHSNWPVGPTVAGAAVLLGLTALALSQARRRPWLTCGWLWFAGTLVPVLGLAQGGEQAWADRFSYWPHIGLFAAVVWGLAELVARWRIPTAMSATTAGLVLLALGALTWRQVGYWKDTRTLWEHALVVTPDNYRPHMNLGKYLLDRLRPDEAAIHFARGEELSPEIPDFHYALGVTHLAMGEFEEATKELETAAQLDPRPADTWHNLGIAHLNRGQTRRAVHCFRAALERESDPADALAWLGRALWHDGRRREAVRDFREALRIDPRQAWAWYGMGTAYLTAGHADKAADAFRHALQSNPNIVLASSDLGVALGRQGQWGAALGWHQKALKLQDGTDGHLERMHRTPPEWEGVRMAVVFRCRLAHTLNQLGDATAASIYRAALRVDPNWPTKFTARARRLTSDPNPDLRDPRLAVELVRQVIEAIGERDSRMREILADAQAAVSEMSDQEPDFLSADP